MRLPRIHLALALTIAVFFCMPVLAFAQETGWSSSPPLEADSSEDKGSSDVEKDQCYKPPENYRFSKGSAVIQIEQNSESNGYPARNISKITSESDTRICVYISTRKHGVSHATIRIHIDATIVAIAKPPSVGDEDTQNISRSTENSNTASANPNKNSAYIYISISFGAVFILLLFITAVLIIFFPPEKIPPEAMLILRAILGLAGAGVGAALSGMLTVNLTFGQQITIQATSGFALFVLIYLVNPRPHRRS